MMTTPYVIQGTVEGDWVQFFERNKILENNLQSSPNLYRLMKYGKRRHYWSDYIASVPASHGDEVIFLHGMPK